MIDTERDFVRTERRRSIETAITIILVVILVAVLIMVVFPLINNFIGLIKEVIA